VANIKICNKCGKVGLDHYDFELTWNDRDSKYHYRISCEPCRVKQIREWQINNIDKKRATNRKWSNNNKDYMKKYRENNSEYFSEYNKRWRKDNIEHVKQYEKEYNKKTKKRRSIRDRIKKLDIEYGLTPLDYNNMLIKQNYRCDICNIHVDELNKTLCVDHNHNTGNVRALLCSKCNSALGFVDENKNILKNMINYLDKWEETICSNK